jgi:hypothetical protein
MKPKAFSFAVIADQIASRSGADEVPSALAGLAGVPATLEFERTAGDELQGLCDDPAAVVEAVFRLTRLAGWRIGIGVGFVETPLPPSTRAARGGAYLAAREAVTAARRSPTGLALRIDPTVRGEGYRECIDAGTDAESALWLVRSVLARRSAEGWELMDLLQEGLTSMEAAERLGISPSAVSQRLARASRQEVARGAQLSARLLDRLQYALSGARP